MYLNNDISIRDGKLTKKNILEIGDRSDTLINVLNHRSLPKAKDLWNKLLEDNCWKLLRSEVLARWGKPNCTFIGLESSPGVWVLDDSKFKLTWTIWSDLHHKHPWKGTSYELACPAVVTDDELVDALERLVPLLLGK